MSLAGCFDLHSVTPSDDGGSGSGSGGDGAASGGTTGSGGAGGRLAGTGGGAPGSGGAGGRLAGTGGASGTGGAVGTGGRIAGSGGAPGTGGRVTGTGGALGTGGAPGTGGAVGSGGRMAGTGGATSGGCPGVWCDDFENETVGSFMPSGWSRYGGSSGDWSIITDGSKALSQSATSITLRTMYASSAPGAPWSGATTVSGRIKVLSIGLSAGSPSNSMLCVRHTGGAGGDSYCLALLPAMGAQIQVRRFGATYSAPLFPATITTGTWYTASLAIDGTGTLTASLGGITLGSFDDSDPLASGYVAVATQNAVAAFDDIVVTQP